MHRFYFLFENGAGNLSSVILNCLNQPNLALPNSFLVPLFNSIIYDFALNP